MNCLKKFLVLAMLVAMVISLTATAVELSNDGDDENSDLPSADDNRELTTSLRGASRFLAQNYRVVLTCNKYPRVCRTKGSPGPDCCKKKCVNVLTDRINCGMCGKKCKYSETCCRGKCVNVMSNKKHCGKCNNKCKKGSSCAYGMCSYA